jgi:transcription-repair coupling factor (superfamily II helicase)
MDPIREEIYKTEEFGRFQSAIAGLAAGRPLVLTGAAGSLKAFLADALRERLGTQILLIAPGEEEAEMLRDDCAALAGDDRVRLLGVRPLHHTQSLDVSGQISQFEAAGALSAGGDLIVAASVRSVAEPLPAPSHFTDSVIKLRKGASHPFEPFIARLGELGFDRKDFVSGYGEFAVRGGIVDVFPFTGSNPVRLEFWGDDVESIREFDPVSQRSIAALEEAVVVPDLTSRDGASGTSVFSYLRNDAVIFLVSPEMIKAEFDELAKEGVATTLTGDALMAEAGKFRLVIAAETVGSAAERGAQTAAAGTVGSAAGATAATVIPFSARPQPAFNGSLSVFLKSAAELTAAGTEVKVLCHDSRDASRLKDLIAGHKETDDAEPGRFTDDTKPVTLPAGKFSIVTGSLHSGFIIGKHAIFTEHGIFGRARTSGSGRRRRFRGISQRELLQLKKGDFVVHEDQGIGTFAGLTRIKVGEVEQEVIRLRFLEDDTLYVNLNYVNRVKKYSSQEGHTPILHRLGGGEWAKIKSRAKRRIKDIARDIIAIYARRKNEKGFAFSPDSHWQLEMEASFMFEDTRRDRGCKKRHGGFIADGPAHLRRRRLRENRDRRARGVQGGTRRQAGGRARADDDPCPSALRDVPRPALPVLRENRESHALPHAGRAEDCRRRSQRREGGRRHRNAPAALKRHCVQGPRTPRRR